MSNNKSERINWNRFSFRFVDNCNWYVGRSCLFFSRHSHHLAVVGSMRATRTMCVRCSLTMKMTFTFARNIFRATRMHVTTHTQSMNGYCDNATSDIRISILKHFYFCVPWKMDMFRLCLREMRFQSNCIYCWNFHWTLACVYRSVSDSATFSIQCNCRHINGMARVWPNRWIWLLWIRPIWIYMANIFLKLIHGFCWRGSIVKSWSQLRVWWSGIIVHLSHSPMLRNQFT